MTSARIAATSLPPRPVLPISARRLLHTLGHRQLDLVYSSAPVLPYDDSTRFIFFSDCHRGDNSTADAFAPNRHLFLNALTYYAARGFHYVEVGDGDELWKNRELTIVQRAHGPVFDLLHRLDAQSRLHLIVGNHDVPQGTVRAMAKDGLLAVEGLILQHIRTDHQILVTHGHQVDLASDGLSPLSRFTVRNVWRRLQLLGIGRGDVHALRELAADGWWPRIARALRFAGLGVEERLRRWIQTRGLPLIAGHTHRARCAQQRGLPYSNCGSCTSPGYLTGLELVAGRLSLVRWQGSSTPLQGIRRYVLTPGVELLPCTA